MEIAAAGGHNLLMIGPPGSGKTMLARRLAGILPPMSFEEALETTQIHSVARRKEESSELLESRPFRAPHHSISDAALVGGGAQPQPGEISMAHNGILFLDELPEFRRSVLEVLRQPMEEGMVTIARARSVVDYPARFMLVAAMNPCPCGYQNHPGRNCSCPERAIERYMSKVSGPLMDRIDMHLEVLPVEASQLQDKTHAESSKAIRQRVVAARLRQRDRLKDSGVHSNSRMSKKQIDSFCALDSAASALLHTAMERMQLSARAFDKILKIGRTIADLEGVENIKDTHLAEAIQYRSLDRKAWSA
jgi:magnesium chelatase family protein